ncbi:MAG: Gfo/Idh/MocA family oxidoreductase [Alphaproteobacteria bacterium]|nr:Gfo/Idh/MocA family oxidoreductase [Alphaproteobacteria bacterium]
MAAPSSGSSTRPISTPGRATGRGSRAVAFSAEFDAVLADPAVQAVILCTPHSRHTAEIARAAAARKHVFCEKPLALKRTEAA